MALHLKKGKKGEGVGRLNPTQAVLLLFPHTGQCGPRGLGLRTLCSSVSAPATVPSTLHGFEALRKDTVKEYNAVVTLWQHQKTGCEVLSVQSEDENKVRE